MGSGVCDAYCHRCRYFQPTHATCNYLLLTDQLRGCPAGSGCDKRMTRRGGRKPKNMSIPISKDSLPKVTDYRKRTREVAEEEHLRRLELYNQGLCDREIGLLVGKKKETIAFWRRRNDLKAHYDNAHRRIDEHV